MLPSAVSGRQYDSGWVARCALLIYALKLPNSTTVSVLTLYNYKIGYLRNFGP
jgi:hypothetical protein